VSVSYVVIKTQHMRQLFTLCLVICATSLALAQAQQDSVIQFSGRVVTSDGDNLIPLPYTSIGIVGTSRGSNADQEGFFSFVALKGETVRFSRIGYKDADYTVPDTLSQSLYFYVQIMTEDSILLPEAVIYPWPDREYFKYEFLAIDISDDERERLQQNLAQEVLAEIRYSVPADGNEVADLELRQRASEYYYEGQIKPQNIFNPLAWKRFVDAWRRGDFKNKKKDKKKIKSIVD